MYMYFNRVFPFHAMLYFKSSTSQKLQYIYPTAEVFQNFSDF